MGLETIIKIIVGTFLFSLFGSYFNLIFYYFFYSCKFLYAGFKIIFDVLGTSDLSVGILYYAILFFLVYFLIIFILKFIK